MWSVINSSYYWGICLFASWLMVVFSSGRWCLYSVCYTYVAMESWLMDCRLSGFPSIPPSLCRPDAILDCFRRNAGWAWHSMTTASTQADIFGWRDDNYWCWTCSSRNVRANREGSRPLLSFHLWRLYGLACPSCLRSLGNASTSAFRTRSVFNLCLVLEGMSSRI